MPQPTLIQQAVGVKPIVSFAFAGKADYISPLDRFDKFLEHIGVITNVFDVRVLE
ncbi:hypothetical protein VAE151_580102 [Vibrio aestuarianus]|nr:hypothetical protein VAE308_1080103 [Vibrio aestuarianus]CAH8217681.1 hypothetical protein VAE115_350105 [Vibrio aestuarianus]CAH8228902.1 hypothetical protein VAE151_580102 [Vibrio aestuarianus]CAH8232255.1 hypothetical protein VAEKB19_4580006 [Vibrio aestuarianus]